MRHAHAEVGKNTKNAAGNKRRTKVYLRMDSGIRVQGFEGPRVRVKSF